MKKVGLCIVYRNHNYGSILQSYATLLKVRSMGCDCEVISYSPQKNAAFYLKSLHRLRNRDMIYGKLRSLKRKAGKIIHKEFKKNDNIRGKRFQEFVEKNIGPLSKPIHDFNELKEYANRFTDIIVGSDQLWLPSGLDTNFYNLMFVPDGINKISYAASFGVSQIPNHQTDRTREFLQRINHLSVREESGKRIIESLTEKTAAVILDPTMIIDKSVWDEHIQDKQHIEGDYIFCYFLGNNSDQREEVKKLAKSKNMKIVVLRHLDEYIPEDENFGDIAPYDVGPAEFVNLIRHAKYVCTDSFHGSVFSIIYHKQFISFNRYAEGTNSRNSRLDTLFRNIGISRRFEGDLISQIDQSINWDDVDNRLDMLRSQSSQFITDALGIVDPAENKIEIREDRSHVICAEAECTGCGVCTAVCPKNAISMKMDRKGFWRPSIDLEICIKCNSCNRICPINEAPKTYGPTKAYAYQNTDEVRFNSTSGGFFNAIACKILDEGGVVCGAAFDKNMVLRHTFVEKKEDLEPLQRSKYVQSSMEGVYKTIKDYLNNGRKVLFAGVGCQAASLYNYVGKRENLIIVDLVCHGVPSSGLFQDWIQYLENKYDKVANVMFRDKSYGYDTPNAKVVFKNGKRIESCRDSDVYRNFFFRHLSIRESCYNCRFKTLNRVSDITIGDLWNIALYDRTKDDNKGTTCVFAHTQAGNDLCKEICFIEIEPQSLLAKDAINMVTCVSPATQVQSFWKLYQDGGFEALLHKYENNTLTRRLKTCIKRIANISGISKRYYHNSNK